MVAYGANMKFQKDRKPGSKYHCLGFFHLMSKNMAKDCTLFLGFSPNAFPKPKFGFRCQVSRQVTIFFFSQYSFTQEGFLSAYSQLIESYWNQKPKKITYHVFCLFNHQSAMHDQGKK